MPTNPNTFSEWLTRQEQLRNRLDVLLAGDEQYTSEELASLITEARTLRRYTDGQ